MTEKERTCDYLLLLVGSNPLPNYITALILKPRSIRLFYSPETEKVKKHLWEALKAGLSSAHLDERCIEDVTSAAKVRQAFGSIPSDAHLHYTGGTKIMAAHARMAFRESGGKDEQASYLDERKGVLRLDSGYEIDLATQKLRLTLADLLALHGIEPMKGGNHHTSRTRLEDAEKIASAVLNDPHLASKLYRLHREPNNKEFSHKKAKANAVNIGESVPGLNLSIQQVPEQDWNRETYEAWMKFLWGGWLEVWCGSFVRQLVGTNEVAVGLNCKRPNARQFEIDVAVVRGHRLYVISCTTDDKTGLCKSKLFEVAMRARQLGGDLARSALMCLLHGNDAKGAFVDQLRNDVADVWDAPNTPQVFGLDDLREWAGIGGRPNVDSLRRWLES